ncbi:peroxisomal membrane protein [Malassezia pachydermatis]
MVTLFGSGSLRDRWKKIIQATRQHSVRLCTYVAIYKTCLLILRDLFHEGKQSSADPFIAGMLGGWYMFGDRTPIVLYCVSRCIASLLPRAQVPKDYPKNKVLPIDNTAHQIFAALTWGTVMWLFVNERRRLNGGLVNSMDYLYVLSDKWNSLRNFLWHNV